jgi:acetolactate synthase I/II/III large subunit
VHVEAGTLHQGAALHTASRGGWPVVLLAGGAPTSYPGKMRGGRGRGGHLWAQQAVDQNGSSRAYTKWQYRLEYQDHPGLQTSRALQVALTSPRGAVAMTIPSELAFLPAAGPFPSAGELGIPASAYPSPQAISEIARRLVAAERPWLVVSDSGRDQRTVEPLVRLCALLGMPVSSGFLGGHLSFPKGHPLYQRLPRLPEADVVLVIESTIPWIPGENAPAPDAFIAVCSTDAIQARIPTYEFEAHIRVSADPYACIIALLDAVQGLDRDQNAVRRRTAYWAECSSEERAALISDAASRCREKPIDPLWLSHQIAQIIDDGCIVMDDNLTPQLESLLTISAPGSYFKNPGTSGGWGPAAAFGAKLAAPDRDVIAVTGDGFYQYSTANAALWAAVRYKAPFLTVVYQNRSYSTGTTALQRDFPVGFAEQTEYLGGYFDPPIDFAKEAAAAGAYGENVDEPAEIRDALERGLRATRSGVPAVVSVRLPRIYQHD